MQKLSELTMAKPEAAVQAGGLTKITKRKRGGGMEMYKKGKTVRSIRNILEERFGKLNFFETIVCSRSFICDVDLG